MAQKLSSALAVLLICAYGLGLLFRVQEFILGRPWSPWILDPLDVVAARRDLAPAPAPAAGGAASGGCLFAFVGLSRSSFWADELFTMQVVDHHNGLGEVFRRVLADEGRLLVIRRGKRNYYVVRVAAEGA